MTIFEVNMRALDSYRVQNKLLKGKHVKDVTLVNPSNMPTLVASELEDVTHL